MNLQNTHDSILKELGIETMKLDWTWMTLQTYKGEDNVVQCHDGLLVVDSLPSVGYHPFVQNMIDGKANTGCNIGKKARRAPMTKCDQVTIMGFRYPYNLSDMVKYTDPTLFPNLVGVCCYKIRVRNDEDYKNLQTIASRLKYLRCDGDIFYDNAYAAAAYAKEESDKLTLRFEHLRCGFFNHGFENKNKFILNLPECEVISIDIEDFAPWLQDLNPFRLSNNPKNKFFRFEMNWGFYRKFSCSAFCETLKGFTYMEEVSYHPGVFLESNSSLLDSFLLLDKLKGFSCVVSKGTQPEEPVKYAERLLTFHENVLGFIVMKTSLTDVRLEYERDDHIDNYIFTQVTSNTHFPRLFMVSGETGLVEYDAACIKACQDRDFFIGFDVADTLSNFNIPLTLEQQNKYSILGKKVPEDQSIVLGDEVLRIIVSYLRPQ